MHYCFRIPEILDIICFHALHEEPGISTQSLTVLARTCRNFYEPAVSRMWHTLQNIQPVIKCLGSDVYSQDEFNRPLILLRALDQSDVVVLKKFLHRVRVLWMSEGSGLGELETDIYEELNSLFDGQFLFENLRTFYLLILAEPRACFVPFLRLLMGPRLSVFHSHLEREPEFPQVTGRDLALEDFFLGLSSQHPQLTDVEITGFGRTSRRIADTAHKWVKLKSLHVNTLELPALRRLAALPSLEKLDFAIWFEPKSNGSLRTSTLFPDFPIQPFPSLCEITILICHMVHGNHFINLLWAGIPLRKIEIVSKDEANIAEYTSLVESIASQVASDKLTWLTINVGGLDHEDKEPNHCFLPFSTLKPLIQFRSLTTLSISASDGWNISDKEMDSFCAAMPQLQACHFYNLPGIPLTYRMTLRVLVSFALHCQELQHLTIAFDARMNRFPKIDSVPIQRSLTDLNVWDSPIDPGSSEPITEFIHSAFPLLEEVFTEADVNIEEREEQEVTGMRIVWNEVADHLYMWSQEEDQEDQEGEEEQDEEEQDDSTELMG